LQANKQERPMRRVSALILISALIGSQHAPIAGVQAVDGSPAPSQATPPAPAKEFENAGVIRRRLRGTWRPFNADSPWNRSIGENPPVHEDSDEIIQTIVGETRHLRFANYFVPPVWIVNADNLPMPRANAKYAFDTWDQDNDGLTDCGIPILDSMWGEQTSDGHIIVIDPFRELSWEMSRFTGLSNGRPQCSTFNIWDLTGTGVGDGGEGQRWWARGGRGSGFPVIAGLVRPEEIKAGRISHALVCTFNKNRVDHYVPPACRTDGRYAGQQFPMQGMLLQLAPSLTKDDFRRWGLTREAVVVARALQEFGLYIGDNGGAMALQAQLLDPDTDKHLALWESSFPGFFRSVQKIPTRHLRVLRTGDKQRGDGLSRVVTPLITPP
jgi:hypothetical protein